MYFSFLVRTGPCRAEPFRQPKVYLSPSLITQLAHVLKKYYKTYKEKKYNTWQLELHCDLVNTGDLLRLRLAQGSCELCILLNTQVDTWEHWPLVLCTKLGGGRNDRKREKAPIFG